MSGQAARTGAFMLLLTVSLAGCGARTSTEVATEAAPRPPPMKLAPEAPPPVDLEGTWVVAAGDDALQPVGDKPALTPAGKKLFDAHRSAAAHGDRSWDLTRRCLPPGTPRLMTIAQPFEIALDEHLALLTFQYQRLARFIYLDDAFPAAPEASFLGESHGHWDGQTLVVETRNFRPGMVLDASGLPQGSRLLLTERLELSTPGTLIDHLTISDEEMYLRPWQAEVSYRHSPQAVREEACVEPGAAASPGLSSRHR